MEITEVVNAQGHENVRSTHKTTLEITKDKALTKRGDCIIAVGATKGALDLSPKFKTAAKIEGVRITVTIESGGVRDVVRAEGSPRLLFVHPTEMVVRKSDYVCDRTIAIRADKGASDLSRKLVRMAMNPHQKTKITLTAGPKAFCARSNVFTERSCV